LTTKRANADASLTHGVTAFFQAYFAAIVHDVDARIRSGKQRLHRRAYGLRIGWDPGEPGCIHLDCFADVSKPHVAGKNPQFVSAGGNQESFDCAQDFFGLFPA